jgi:tyrosinase
MPLRPPRPADSRPKAVLLLLGLLALFAASQAASQVSRSEPMTMKILARSVAPVSLGIGPVVVPLADAGKPLAARVDTLAPGRSLYLVVRGLTAVEPPGVLYGIYLDLPAGAKPGVNDPRRAGIINFYGARPPGAANAPDAESPVNTDAEKVFFSFDLTPMAQALRQRGQLAERTTLTLIPEGVPTPTAKALVGHLELVEQ